MLLGAILSSEPCQRDRDSLAGKGDEEGTEDILSLRESWPLQVVPGQGSRWVGGLEHRPQCGCVGRHHGKRGASSK